MDLPPLNQEPTRYPDFCLSVSAGLVQALTGIFSQFASQSGLVLSVGSGSGLLEEYLHSSWSSKPDSSLAIHGVEVRTAHQALAVNRYLPQENCSTVRGTWELSPHFKRASGLMFVYPREPGLIQRYLCSAAQDKDSLLRVVVWVGPKADWDTFEACLRDAPGFCPVELPQDTGLASYEMMAVIRKNSGEHPSQLYDHVS